MIFYIENIHQVPGISMRENIYDRTKENGRTTKNSQGRKALLGDLGKRYKFQRTKEYQANIRLPN